MTIPFRKVVSYFKLSQPWIKPSETLVIFAMLSKTLIPETQFVVKIYSIYADYYSTWSDSYSRVRRGQKE